MQFLRHGRPTANSGGFLDAQIRPRSAGAQDIYIMDIASKQWVQLTHDGGRNDFPYWSPDGRHIVFQSSRAGFQIWTMLADGTNQKQLRPRVLIRNPTGVGSRFALVLKM